MDHPSLFDPPAPASRRHDPQTSRQAATKVGPGNGPLVEAIRACLHEHGPQDQFSIALLVGRAHDHRWAADTIRSGCARAGLTVVGHVERGGRTYGVYDHLQPELT